MKLSGEALANGSGELYDVSFVDKVATALKKCSDEGYGLAVVVGAGNIWRGRQGGEMDRTSADRMGMLATVINAICLKEAIVRAGGKAEVMSAVAMAPFALTYTAEGAKALMEAGTVVVLGAGLGIPFLSTDTTGAVRAAEVGADVMLMAKNGVDGIYSDDPRTNPNAKKYSKITYDDIIIKGLKVMDTASCALCKQNSIPIMVFDFAAKGSIIKILKGEEIGTYVGG